MFMGSPNEEPADLPEILRFPYDHDTAASEDDDFHRDVMLYEAVGAVKNAFPSLT
jgi:hypothetical protein